MNYTFNIVLGMNFECGAETVVLGEDDGRLLAYAKSLPHVRVLTFMKLSQMLSTTQTLAHGRTLPHSSGMHTTWHWHAVDYISRFTLHHSPLLILPFVDSIILLSLTNSIYWIPTFSAPNDVLTKRSERVMRQRNTLCTPVPLFAHPARNE